MMEYIIIGLIVLGFSALVVFARGGKGTKMEQMFMVARIAVETVEQEFKFERQENETEEEAEARRNQMHQAGIENLKELLLEFNLPVPSDQVLSMLIKAGVYTMNLAKNMITKES